MYKNRRISALFVCTKIAVFRRFLYVQKSPFFGAFCMYKNSCFRRCLHVQKSPFFGAVCMYKNRRFSALFVCTKIAVFRRFSYVQKSPFFEAFVCTHFFFIFFMILIEDCPSNKNERQDKFYNRRIIL